MKAYNSLVFICIVLLRLHYSGFEKRENCNHIFVILFVSTFEFPAPICNVCVKKIPYLRVAQKIANVPIEDRKW